MRSVKPTGWHEQVVEDKLMYPYAAIASNDSLLTPLRQTRDVDRMSRTLDDERCMWCKHV